MPARGFDMTETDHYRALLEISKAILAHKDLHSLFRELAHKLPTLLNLDFVGLALHDPTRQVMRAYTIATPGDIILPQGLELPVDEAPGGWVWRTQQPLVVENLEAETRFPKAIQMMRVFGVQSFCILPLTTSLRKIGGMGFGRLQSVPFGNAQLDFLQQVANQVAVAVDNVLNYESLDAAQQGLARERDRLRLLLEINNAVVSHLDLRGLLKSISACLRPIIPHDAALLTLKEPGNDQLRLHALDLQMFGQVPFEEGVLISMHDTPEGQAIMSRQPVLVGPSVDLARFSSPWVRHAVENGVKSGCAVPLITHERTLGALSVVSQRENAFTASDVELLGQCANQIAIAVANALNFERARKAEQEVGRKFERERLMLQINNAVVSQLDLRDLVRVISSSLSEALDINAVGLSLYEPESACFRVYYYDLPETIPSMEAGATIPAEGSIGGLALTLGRPILVNRASEAEAFPESKRRFYDHGFNSGGCVPLIMQGRKLGVLGVLSFREDAFPEERQQLLCQIADQIAIATENAVNFERARKAEQALTRQLERERLMLEITNAVVSHLELSDLLKTVSACLKRVLPHDLAGIALYDAVTGQLKAHALDFPQNQEFVEMGDAIPIDGTPEGLAFKTRRQVLIKRLDLSEFTADIMRRAVAEGLKSGCTVPLISRGRVLGTLSVVSVQESAFSQDDADLFDRIGAQVAIAIENGLAYQEIANLKDKLDKEKLYLEEEIRSDFEDIIGESAELKKVLKQVEIVASTDSTVLILGETGTGKELIARAIHNLSGRQDGTFVKLNCAAIPTGLLESELFGHEKGAFTGAIATKIGRFELADKGTLFLDEVGEIPLELQVKLLRVLQEQEFERLGSTRTIRVNVRVVAATNRDLAQMVEEQRFRSDLYYRLKVFPITVPPLRERAGDIPSLVRYFTQKFALRMKKRIDTVPAETMKALQAYPWPGNVRELENCIERAVILSSGADLFVPLSELKRPDVSVAKVATATLEQAERDHILKVLRDTKWVIGGAAGAAAKLGMKRTTLQSKMQKLGISRPS